MFICILSDRWLWAVVWLSLSLSLARLPTMSPWARACITTCIVLAFRESATYVVTRLGYPVLVVSLISWWRTLALESLGVLLFLLWQYASVFLQPAPAYASLTVRELGRMLGLR